MKSAVLVIDVLTGCARAAADTAHAAAAQIRAHHGAEVAFGEN